jgi:hypothetical protein
LAAVVVVAGEPVVPAAAAAAGSGYVPVVPVRVLNTVNGTGGQTGPLGPNSVIKLQVDGVAGVPATGVSAVVLNVTAVKGTAASFVTVYPDGGARPDVSNLNFTAGETIPNLLTVPVGANGKVDFYNHAGSVTLTADLAGYYVTTGGSLFAAVSPVRVLNTTNGTGGHTGPVGPNSSISLQVSDVDGVPLSRVAAVVLNVTAVKPTAAGFVTVWPAGAARPDVSNLNFTAGQTIPNQVVVELGPSGKVDFYNHAGSVTLTADLAGFYYAAGSQFTSAGPVRVLNTVTGTGGHTGPLGPNATIKLQVDGVGGVPSSGVSAVVLNVTAVKGTAASFVTVYPDGGARPDVSNLNFTAGETIPNLVTVPVGPDGKIDFYNHSGSVTLTADLAGYYLAGGQSWGNAVEVPGTAALNAGGVAVVSSVSCPSAGNCMAGGQYADKTGISAQAFVADEVNGTWHNAIEVPGTAALNTGDYAFVNSVSCPLAGNCAAVGNYTGSAGEQAFVAVEVNGSWATAIEVPGIAALATGLNASSFVSSVSCGSAGNCAAAGSYFTSGHSQAFVVDEVNGTWGNAIEVPGTAALNTTGGAAVGSVSCPSAGNCVAGGGYSDSSGNEAFVVSEVNGTWGNAIEVPGTAALNSGGSAGVGSVSCPSPGNCTAGGSYTVSPSSNLGNEAFVVSEVNGTWGNAIEVPGSAALNTGGVAYVSSVSCPSAGNCAAGGEYAYAVSTPTGPSWLFQPFVVNEVSGTWGNAIQVPGTPASSNQGDAIYSVSCPSAGNCAAVVTSGVNNALEGFVVSEVNGTWGQAIQIPGVTNSGGAADTVSCPPTAGCVAGGEAPANQAFVVSQN